MNKHKPFFSKHRFGHSKEKHPEVKGNPLDQAEALIKERRFKEADVVLDDYQRQTADREAEMDSARFGFLRILILTKMFGDESFYLHNKELRDQAAEAWKACIAECGTPSMQNYAVVLEQNAVYQIDRWMNRLLFPLMGCIFTLILFPMAVFNPDKWFIMLALASPGIIGLTVMTLLHPIRFLRCQKAVRQHDYHENPFFLPEERREDAV